VDSEENYAEDHFVANYIGWRGDSHQVGNLILRWKVENICDRWTGRSAEIEVWT
jgi:hypothetical protein